jgi:hypothetical protein
MSDQVITVRCGNFFGRAGGTGINLSNNRSLITNSDGYYTVGLGKFETDVETKAVKVVPDKETDSGKPFVEGGTCTKIERAVGRESTY